MARLKRREVLKSLAVVSLSTAWGIVRLGRSSLRAVYAGEANPGGPAPSRSAPAFLRPPGAVSEAEFVRRCIRCHKCAENCPNSYIGFVGPEGPPEARGTPLIRPREKACILCMKCNNSCPSGALRSVDPEHAAPWQAVRMGTAVVDTNICFSFNGYICGICVRACPLEGVALKAELWERPVVVSQRCVGCGLCEQACVHMPQAIRIVAALSRDVQA